jgi:hypothetical protein
MTPVGPAGVGDATTGESVGVAGLPSVLEPGEADADVEGALVPVADEADGVPRGSTTTAATTAITAMAAMPPRRATGGPDRRRGGAAATGAIGADVGASSVAQRRQNTRPGSFAAPQFGHTTEPAAASASEADVTAGGAG